MKASKKLFDSFKKEIKKKDEKTSFQIRIFDDHTGNAAYKHLTGNELLAICKLLDDSLDFL